jgi:DNA-binding XRE family transcriptional regulator
MLPVWDIKFNSDCLDRCVMSVSDYKTNLTPEEIEISLGDDIKNLRLQINLEQKTLAERAGVSLKAIQNLENGNGSTLKSLVKIVRALGRESWFGTIAPVASINPLTMPVQAEKRQRASRKRMVTNKLT